jgi:hypothetical protein
MPRALATNAAKTLVFTAIFNSGNRTTIVPAASVEDSVIEDLDFPRDTGNKHGHTNPPTVGEIVQYQQFGGNGAGWYDEYGKLWSSKVKYGLPDNDVVEINATSHTVSRNFAGIGSINMNLAVDGAGRVATVGTEARSQLRFENKLRGYVVDTRVGYVSVAGTITFRLLNPHINYSVVPGTQAERDSALGIPTSVAFASTNNRLYVTAFANDKIGVLNPAAGANQVLGRIPCVAGPSALLLDEARHQIYVLGRFHNVLQTLSLDDFHSVEITRVGFDPTPDAIVNGRKFFYGGFTSGHGDQACASCHVFGDIDNLVWDLGNPLAEYVDPPDPNPLELQGFDPQKGPMVTQSLRGLIGTEPFHWRGDRANLSAFNPAFVGLMGRQSQLPDSEMTAFNDFVMPLAYPPNPHRFLDNTLPAYVDKPSPGDGETFFMNTQIDGTHRCVDCHTGPHGTNVTMVPNDTLLEFQDFKVPQLRNLYKKTGFHNDPAALNKRGFGYSHDGSIDNVARFLQSPQFSFDVDTTVSQPQRRNLEAFLLAFPTGTPPAVGVQVTFDGTSFPEGASRVDTLRSEFGVGNIGVIAKGRIDTQPRGWEYVGGDSWVSDKTAESPITTAQLIALATDPAHAVTVTGVPVGSQHRIGIDRDRDGFLDGDELDAGSDGGDPQSTPANVGVRPGATARIGFEPVTPNPSRQNAQMWFSIARTSRVDAVIYDVLGREVKVLARGRSYEPGRWGLVWDGRRNDGGEAGVGVYFARVKTIDGTWVRPIVRIR